MDLEFSPKQRAFRVKVRDWLHDNIPTEKRPDDGLEMRAFDTAWQRKQYDSGWAALSWPKEHGGGGYSVVERLIWWEEYACAKAPWIGCMWAGLNHAGPTLITVGDDQQRAVHLPKILKGEAVWCQGFSEPGAGSDLASLKTRGDIDGDHLLINGSKIWTSFSPVADYQELLVRTDRSGPKHQGISWVICDMRSPGIEIRPIRTMAGHQHFAQIFYNDVRIPLTNVVGGMNNGWSVTQATLGFERGAFILEQVELVKLLESLIQMARTIVDTDTGRKVIEDDEVAMKLATMRAEVCALRSLTYVAVSRSQSGAPPGPEASIIRLFYSELLQRMRRLAMDVLGAECLNLEAGDSWPERYLDMFRHTIAAGTSEIQRNIIGERMLGLPRER
jgi:alkylation response protein AidB-like acyl-CoA dehydrogenase